MRAAPAHLSARRSGRAVVWPALAVVGAVVGLGARPLAAQAPGTAPATGVPATPVAGTRVRFVAQRGDRTITCVGRVTRGSAAPAAGDTLGIAAEDGREACPRGTYPAADLVGVSVVRADRGSQAATVGVALLAGVVVGAVMGRVGLYELCQLALCKDGGSTARLVTAGGAGGGGIVGLVVGAEQPAGPEWMEVPIAGPIHVAGWRVTPGLRVAVAPRR